MAKIEPVQLKRAKHTKAYMVQLKPTVIGGAHEFDVVKCKNKVAGRKLSMRMIGLGEQHCIPDTEHHATSRVEDMPLKSHDVVGKTSRIGTVNRVLKANTLEHDDVVIKIPLSDGVHNHPANMDYKIELDEAISSLVPAAKLLKVVWLKGVNYKGMEEENPHGIPVEFHEHISDKNLLQERLGEDEFVHAMQEVASITLKLFKNNILYTDTKPENFCRHKSTGRVMVVDKNGTFWRYKAFFGKAEKKGKETEMMGQSLARCLYTLYLSNFDPARGIEPGLPDRAMRGVSKTVKGEISGSKLSNLETNEIMNAFQNELAKLIRDKKRLVDLKEFS